MLKPRRYGGKSHPATPTQEQTRPISTETSNLYKKYAVFDVSCKNEHWKKNVASWWPNRAGMVGNLHPATLTQEQTRPISTETSNLDKKYAVFDVSCKNEPWKKKRCKLMTKPRRYGGKSHPATPTQEQTRPISTETSNLVEKYAVSDICCVNGHCRNKNIANWWPNRADMVEKSHPATPTQEQTRPMTTEASNLYKKYIVSDISYKNEPWKNKRCKLMTKPRRYGGKSHPATPTQEQTRPISTETSNLYEKYAVFDVSCKNERWKNKRCKLMTKPRRYGGESHPATPTQEQTRPMTTEASNLYKKYTISDISCVNGHCRNKTFQIDD